MKVAELIAELQKLPQDAEAVVARDAEGNGFDTVHQVTLGKYSAGDFWDNDDEGSDSNAATAVCIWP